MDFYTFYNTAKSYNIDLTKLTQDLGCVSGRFDYKAKNFVSYYTGTTFPLVTYKIDNLNDFFSKWRNCYMAIRIDSGYLDFNKLRLVIVPKIEQGKTREKIYKTIDAERDYQDHRWNNDIDDSLIPDEDKSVAEWLIYIENHLNKAKENIYHLDKTAALDEVRKLVALGVRCMEIHGCPERKFTLKGKM